MNVTQHRNAVNLIAEKMVATVAGEGLNHGMPGRRWCPSVLATKINGCSV